MANPEHLKILKRGTKIWNNWRSDNPNIKPDLSGANLERTDFRAVNLSGVNLERSDLYGANLAIANLEGANLSYAIIGNVKLFSTTLKGANLTNAQLKHVILRDSLLDEANFLNCQLGHCVFSDCDLSRVKNLDKVLHTGASTIGIDTLYKSRGNIPEIFLRKAGVPDVLITYMKSLIDNPIEYYSCFISYTEKDDAFSERLYNDLQIAGVRCWRWKEDAKWGEVMREEIDTAVWYYDKLVVICSKASLKSPAVIEEIKRALNKEDTQGTGVLFPIVIDNYLLKDWDHYLKVRITDKIVGDFRDWNTDPEKYRKSVERLVKDLNRPRKQ